MKRTSEAPVRLRPPRGNKELYEWLDRYKAMPYPVRKVVPLPIGVEIALRQCTGCGRFVCRCAK